MRRWFLYLFIGFSAFGIGSLIAEKFCLATEKVVPNAQEVYKTRSFGNFHKNLRKDVTQIPPQVEESDDSYKCSGLDNEDFFEPAIERWMKGKKISSKPMRPPGEYQSDGDEYTASLVDVNQDGKDELMIKAYCSPIENCRFFIYEKQGKEYRQLFFSRTGIQTISFVETSINHYPKISVRTKLDEKSGFYSTYKFDKTYYETTDCAKYVFDKFGKDITTPVDCYLVDDGKK